MRNADTQRLRRVGTPCPRGFNTPITEQATAPRPPANLPPANLPPASRSQMPRLHRRRRPIIIGPIDIPHRRRNQFPHLHIIQTRHRHRNKRPEQSRLPRRKHIDPTHPAKAMPIPARPKPVLPHHLRPGQQSKTRSPHLHSPEPHLRTHRTITLHRPRNRQVERRLIPHRPAMTTSPIRLHPRRPVQEESNNSSTAQPPAQPAHCGVQCPFRPVSASAPHPC